MPGQMSNPTIRPAQPSDLPGVLALYRHLNSQDPAPDTAKAESAWALLLSSGLTTVFVADAGASWPRPAPLWRCPT